MVRSAKSGMFCFAKALYQRNLMTEVDYLAMTRMYEQVELAQSKDTLQTTVVLFLMPGEDCVQKRVLARSNQYDKNLSIELQSLQYSLHQDLLDKYREEGYEVAVVYGEHTGVNAAQLLGELYAYLGMRRKVGRFISEPTPSLHKFQILRVLPPLCDRVKMSDDERAAKMPRVMAEAPPGDDSSDSGADDGSEDASEESGSDDDGGPTANEVKFDKIRRKLRWSTVTGDKSQVFN